MAVGWRDGGDREEVINVEEVGEGGASGGQDLVHDGVGDGGDEIPSKGWASEGEIFGGVVGVSDGEDEG